MKIVWSVAAADDLDRIQAYLEPHSARAARGMWVRIHERVGALSAFPLSAPVHGEGPMRKLVVTGTPYIVLYLVDDKAVRIEAIFHSAQNV